MMEMMQDPSTRAEVEAMMSDPAFKAQAQQMMAGVKEKMGQVK
jgi:UDP:flavonoid glycosyltransferase YjiC (YdhE family)